MRDSTLDYIRSHYHVPANRGGRVRFEGKPGTIIGGATGPYIRVRLDGEKREGIYHPTWHMEYEDAPSERREE